jgi:hypothetical protein
LKNDFLMQYQQIKYHQQKLTYSKNECLTPNFVSVLC